MAKLIFMETGESEEVPDGSPIAEACERAGVPFACTEGVCGTCVVRVRSPAERQLLTPPTEAEADFFGAVEEERLACQCCIRQGTVHVEF
ncbi:MAG: 2Fe-2S iron-sulfur cluster-binding protein [Chlamydiia bacterium]